MRKSAGRPPTRGAGRRDSRAPMRETVRMNAREKQAEGWARLSSYIRSRRVHLGYNRQSDLAHAAGVALRTVATVEGGRRVWPATLAKLEAGLGWKPGSAEAVIDGGEPELNLDTAPPLADPHERAIWALTDLDPDTRWSLINHLREQRQQKTG